MLELPPETLELITKKVPRRDHKELRLVSRQLYLASYCWCLIGTRVRYDAGHKCVLKVDPCTEFTKENVSNIWVAKKILKQNDANWDDGFAWASIDGHTDAVKLLLADSRVNPAARANQAIRWASANGHMDVIKLLLAYSRVDCTANNHQAIRWALEGCRDEIVALLRAHC